MPFADALDIGRKDRISTSDDAKGMLIWMLKEIAFRFMLGIDS